MTIEELLGVYDRDLRAEAEVADADPEHIERIGPLWVATFPARRRAFLTYRDIPAGTDVEALVATVVAHVDANELVDRVEWKTRGHDPVPRLTEILEAHGFVLEEPETVMLGDIEAVIAADPGLPDGMRIERADTEAEIREAEALAGRVFGDSPAESSAMADELVARRRRHPGSFEMWLVRDAGGTVVCSGRVDVVAGTDVAGLWGGACDDAHRGRGLYRALTAARARSVRARGTRYLHSDCTEFSRPILERAGLVAITTTTPAVRRRPGAARPVPE